MTTTATMTITLDHPVADVFSIVSSLTDYAWRSDLNRIEIMESANVFKEYTKDGFCTTFTITMFKQNERYEFDIENKNMSGHWIGTFASNGQQTIFTCTEMIDVKKIIMKPLIKSYLKKQQTTYLNDLIKALDTL